MESTAVPGYLFTKIQQLYLEFGQKLGAYLKASSDRNKQRKEIGFAVLLISWGFSRLAVAQSDTEVDQTKLHEAIQILMSYIEGPFGALIAICSGLGAILSCAFGQYRSALSFLIVSVGSFILRAFVLTFFKDVDGLAE